MTGPGESREVAYGWVIVWASLGLNTVALCAPNILFVTLKSIAAEFDWPRAVPSTAYALLMIGSGLGGVLMGWWMDKRGVMQPVLFGSVMIGVGALVASQADTRWSLYLANGLLIGLLGEAAMFAPLIANATRWFDRRRGLAVGLIASGQGVAGMLWPPLLQRVNETHGWRGAFLGYGVIVLLVMVPLALLLKRRPPLEPAATPRRQGDAPHRVLGLSPRLVQGLLYVAVLGCCTAMAMPVVHLISHATDLGFPAAQAARILSVLFAAAFVSRIVFGMIADRIGAVLTLLITSSCQAAMLFVFAFVDSLSALFVAAFLFGLGYAGIMPCYALIIRLWFPANQLGWRVAAQYLFGGLGMALGGWLGGVVFDLSGGYAHAFLVGFGFNLLNLMAVGFLYARQLRLRLSPVSMH